GADVTLQLLPGRLEPVDRGADQEIRFVRVPGVNRFTLGRNPGRAHSHIQLRAATASRMHAFMIFESGRWQLGNMSETNAVVINGAPLNGDPHLLEDGDRIEFGELTFVFRER
ncbi:MAG: FHA domain-containing protein, partial [Longimicrobiales bacterium]